MPRKISVVCTYCGKSFDKDLGHYNEAMKKGPNLFCSRECHREHKVTTITIPCAECGVEVQRPSSAVIKGNVFCSKSCSAKYNNSRRRHSEETKRRISESLKSDKTGHKCCEVCGKTFYVRPSRKNSRCCSTECSYYLKNGHSLISKEELVAIFLGYKEEKKALSSKLVPRAVHNSAKRHFGSWKKALEFCGMPEFIGRPFGEPQECIDGHTADSMEEKAIDDWLFDEDIIHQRNKNYPKSRKTCDFYLPKYDLWIEYLGLYSSVESYRKSYEHKKAMALEWGFTLIGIRKEDVLQGKEAVLEKINGFLIEKEKVEYPVLEAPRTELVCPECGASFNRNDRYIKSKESLGQKRFYCSRSCAVAHNHK